VRSATLLLGRSQLLSNVHGPSWTKGIGSWKGRPIHSLSLSTPRKSRRETGPVELLMSLTADVLVGCLLAEWRGWLK
jgi:hypothetical protein